jgi:hypothetical protein
LAASGPVKAGVVSAVEVGAAGAAAAGAGAVWAKAGSAAAQPSAAPSMAVFFISIVPQPKSGRNFSGFSSGCIELLASLSNRHKHYSE